MGIRDSSLVESYGRTFLKRTPKGQEERPYHGGVFIAEVNLYELSVIGRCQYYRGVRKERFDFTDREIDVSCNIKQGNVQKTWEIYATLPTNRNRRD